MANLEQLVDRARAFAGAGGGGLGASSRGPRRPATPPASRSRRSTTRATSCTCSPSTRRRVSNIRSSSSTEGARRRRWWRRQPIVDRALRRVALKLKVELPGSPADSRAARLHGPPAAREADGRERVRRLLYVAATRARDHLVVSCFGVRSPRTATRRQVLLGPIGHVLPAPEPSTRSTWTAACSCCPLRRRRSRRSRRRAGGRRAVATRRVARAHTLLERAPRPAPATSPSGLEHVDEEVRAGGPGAPAGRAGALALGSAVHRVMELCDLEDEASVERWRRRSRSSSSTPTWPTKRPRSPPPAGERRRSGPRPAVAAWPRAVHRELVRRGAARGRRPQRRRRPAVPRRRRVGRRRLQDRPGRRAGRAARPLSAPGRRLRARRRGRAREGRVREVCFVAARADGLVVRVPVDDELRAEARREIAAAAAAGRALIPTSSAGEEGALGTPRGGRRRVLFSTPVEVSVGGAAAPRDAARRRPCRRPSRRSRPCSGLTTRRRRRPASTSPSSTTPPSGNVSRYGPTAKPEGSAGRRVHARRPALHGAQRRTSVHVQPGGLVRRRLRHPGGGRPLLGAPVGGRRPRGTAVRLAQGQVRCLVADRPRASWGSTSATRTRRRRADDAGDAADEEAGHRRAQAAHDGTRLR